MSGAVLAAGVVAGAASAPALAAVPSAVPSFAQPASAADARISGTVASVPGKYQLQVHDRRGFLDNVELHPGTVINPTGLALEPGMPVTIYGRPAGAQFIADTIDTPYTAVVYPYPLPYWGPGPLWGPRYRLGLRFG